MVVLPLVMQCERDSVARESILTYSIVESLEPSWRKPNRGRCGKVQVAAVEQVEERILQHFRPHLQVLEVGSSMLGNS